MWECRALPGGCDHGFVIMVWGWQLHDVVVWSWLVIEVRKIRGDSYGNCNRFFGWYDYKKIQPLTTKPISISNKLNRSREVLGVNHLLLKLKLTPKMQILLPRGNNVNHKPSWAVSSCLSSKVSPIDENGIDLAPSKKWSYLIIICVHKLKQ